MHTPSIAIALHVLAAVIWVGGMFFSYMILRPAAAGLDPASRILLWSATFKYFFRWVEVAIALLFITGYWMIFNLLHGFAHLSMSVNVMQGIGIIMLIIFGYIRALPHKCLKAAVAKRDQEAASKALGQIRQLILINLSLGLISIAIISGGRYFQ